MLVLIELGLLAAVIWRVGWCSMCLEDLRAVLRMINGALDMNREVVDRKMAEQ
jgi:hypothetical protein